ncbi:MAG TPA: MraY family glycosyltransferase [Candidatus Acidoferrum sp.]|nr:MraY family glycosyltransferase [Candidatus Acidoferrum sp.]
MKFADHLADALPIIFGAFVISGVVAFLLTPVVSRIAQRFEMIDRPDHRRVNTLPVPRGGGIAVAIASTVATVGFLIVNQGPAALRAPASIGTMELAALLAGGIIAAVIGALDDYLQLRARWQLGGQLLLAGLAVALGATPDSITNPFGGTIDTGGLLGVAFTVVWILGMINSINFIDGLDGLSSGIGIVAAVTLGLISLTTEVGGPLGQPFVAVLCFALAGALLGFLKWNFHPAAIFSGTSGVMFVGYTLALLSILGVAKVAVALLVLGVPIIDTFWIIVRRIAAGRSPFTPDRGHIHHRLLDLGLSHRQTVLFIYGICILLGVLSLVLTVFQQVTAFVLFVLLSGVVLFVITRRGLDRRSNGTAPDPTAPDRTTPS